MVDKIKQINEEIFTITGIISQLELDEVTLMPEGSGDDREEQLKYLNLLLKRKYSELSLEDFNLENILPEFVREVEETKRNWIHVTCLPDEIISLKNKIRSKSLKTFGNLRKGETVFNEALTDIQESFKVAKEIAQIKSKHLNLAPYDALLDSFQPGLKSETIDKMFDDIKSFLPSFIKNVSTNNKGKDIFIDKDKEEFIKSLLDMLRFDFNKGSFRKANSNFTNGNSENTALGLNYDEGILELAVTVLHEGGHAIYQQHLKGKRAVDQQSGMAIHEAISRFFENCIGRSNSFAVQLSKLIYEKFEVDISPNDIEEYLKRVSPSFIRINADEVTYILHIIIRYEIERDYFNDKINIEDLESIWNEKMKEYLNIVPSNPNEGFAQDVHWFSGLFGYFPTYAFGSIIAANLYEIASQSIDINSCIMQNDLTPVVKFLEEKIFKYGLTISFEELINISIGEINSDVLKKYFSSKYL